MADNEKAIEKSTFALQEAAEAKSRMKKDIEAEKAKRNEALAQIEEKWPQRKRRLCISTSIS